MTANEVLNLFKIKPTKLISQNDLGKWRRILQDYRNYASQDVEGELKEIMDTHGDECSTLWYLSEVRKKMEIKHHNRYKSLPMPQSIKQIFQKVLYDNKEKP